MLKKIKGLLIIPLIFILSFSFTFSQEIDRASKFHAYNLMEIGILHYNLNQFKAAIDYFTQSLKIYPSLFAAREWKAKSFYRTGQIENAIEEYNRLISINPEDVRLENRLSDLLFSLSHPETFNFEPNFINSAIYPLNSTSNECIPISISLISKNKIAVPDFSSGKVGIYSIDGKYLYSLPRGSDKFAQPFDVTADNNGNIYITDYYENYIYKFSSDLELVNKFGGSGNSPSSLCGPRGIVSDGKYNLYVIDRWNREIKKYSNDGKYILSVSKRVDGLYEISEPYDIAYLSEIIYVTDSENASIFTFDNYGTFINEYKHQLITKPRGISVSNDKEKLYVVDENNGILRLNLNTNKIEKVADLSKINGRFLSVVETYDGRILAINESVTGFFAFIEEVIKSSGLVIKVLRSVINATNQESRISHIISINDKLGKPIIDLQKEYININEEGIELGNPTSIIKYPNLEENGIGITIVNELSFDTEKKQNDIKRFLKEEIVDKLNSNDSLEIINVNEEVILKNTFQSEPLETVYLFNDDKYTNNPKIALGKGLMFGIGQALSVYDKNSAVLFITSGNTYDEALGKISVGEIYNYALANDVPIYIIVFGSNKQNDFLSRLASESGGQVINYYKSPNINKIIDIIKEDRKQYHIITYNTIVGNSNEFRYKEAIIEITSNGMTGSTKVGYFDKYK